MSARFWISAAALLVAAGAAGAAPVLIDHRNVDVTRLALPQIERAKAALHIAYGHTSHGSQLTEGMSGLVGFANGGGKGLALPADAFAWNNGGSGGALDLHDYAMCNDVGYFPDWVVCTSNYLDDPANADVNAARNILERGLDTLAVTSENLWGADGTPVEQGRKTNENATRESVALS